MTRTIILALAAAAMLLLPPNAVPDAQAQQEQLRVDLDQSLLDKWLVAMPQIVKLGKSGTVLLTDDALRPPIQRICLDAGFASYDQCAEVIGYVGMIISGCDRRTRSFRDPMVLMRRQLARLEADTSPPTPERERTIAQLKQVVAAFPERLPRAHLDLMTANRDRIFQAILLAEQVK